MFRHMDQFARIMCLEMWGCGSVLVLNVKPSRYCTSFISHIIHCLSHYIHIIFLRFKINHISGCNDYYSTLKTVKNFSKKTSLQNKPEYKDDIEFSHLLIAALVRII
jgi:hypothetical protein